MAKAKLTVPTGFKISASKVRNGEPGSSFVAFVDKEAGVYASRKGAIARGTSMEIVIGKLNDAAYLKTKDLTRVSRAPAVKAAATKPTKPTANKQLEVIED